MVNCPYQNPSFYLKFSALIINITITAAWIVGTMKMFNCWLPYTSNFQLMIFYHTVPTYMVILPAFIFMHIWDDNRRPTDWDTIVYSLMGFLLFELSGTMGLVNTFSHDVHAKGSRLIYFIISVLAMVNGIIFLLDVLVAIKNLVLIHVHSDSI